MFSVKCLETGEIINNDGSGSIYHNGCTLVVGFDGKIQEIESWAYDGSGGGSVIDVSDKYKLIIDIGKEKQ